MLENAEIRARLKGKVSDSYIEAMIVGLEAWCNAAATGSLAWGFFVFEKI